MILRVVWRRGSRFQTAAGPAHPPARRGRHSSRGPADWGQLFARILQDADARAALRTRLTADPNRLLALPYRLGVFLHSAWLLAAYTQLKNRFL